MGAAVVALEVFPPPQTPLPQTDPAVRVEIVLPQTAAADDDATPAETD